MPRKILKDVSYMSTLFVLSSAQCGKFGDQQYSLQTSAGNNAYELVGAVDLCCQQCDLSGEFWEERKGEASRGRLVPESKASAPTHLSCSLYKHQLTLNGLQTCSAREAKS